MTDSTDPDNLPHKQYGVAVYNGEQIVTCRSCAISAGAVGWVPRAMDGQCIGCECTLDGSFNASHYPQRTS